MLIDIIIKVTQEERSALYRGVFFLCVKRFSDLIWAKSVVRTSEVRKKVINTCIYRARICLVFNLISLTCKTCSDRSTHACTHSLTHTGKHERARTHVARTLTQTNKHTHTHTNTQTHTHKPPPPPPHHTHTQLILRPLFP